MSGCGCIGQQRRGWLPEILGGDARRPSRTGRLGLTHATRAPDDASAQSNSAKSSNSGVGGPGGRGRSILPVWRCATEPTPDAPQPPCDGQPCSPLPVVAICPGRAYGGQLSGGSFSRGAASQGTCPIKIIPGAPPRDHSHTYEQCLRQYGKSLDSGFDTRRVSRTTALSGASLAHCSAEALHA